MTPCVGPISAVHLLVKTLSWSSFIFHVYHVLYALEVLHYWCASTSAHFLLSFVDPRACNCRFPIQFGQPTTNIIFQNYSRYLSIPFLFLHSTQYSYFHICTCTCLFFYLGQDRTLASADCQTRQLLSHSCIISVSSCHFRQSILLP